MICPFCGYENSKVIESRPSTEKSSIRRRRECEQCSSRFTTYEKIEISPPSVIKKNGKREQFSKEKLLTGLINAVKNSDSSTDLYEEIVRKIEEDIFSKNIREISSEKLGEKVLSELNDVNKVAYLRYLSVFKAFNSVESFREYLDKLK